MNAGRFSADRASRIFQGIPGHGRGQRVGLYGGSFNPPHTGHRQIAIAALRRLRLDAVWWLVTPGNPLKDATELAAFDVRLQETAELASHPRMSITGLECVLGTRYTADLVAVLRRRLPHLRFVWVMGSDNLAGFHRWNRWQTIARHLPILAVNRPGTLLSPLNSQAARTFSAYRVRTSALPMLADRAPPAWGFLNCPRVDLSSTVIRDSAREAS